MATYKEIINSSELVLVEYFASWCPHCQRMMPLVKEAKGELEGRCNIFQYDIDANQALASENDVENIPTFILYKDGNEVWRKSGEMTLREMVGTVESYL